MKIITILAILYFLSGKLSFLLSVESSIVTIAIFFAEGISLATILIYGKKVWPGIFIGQLILALSTDLSFFPSVLIASINSLEAILAYYILQKLKFDTSFNKVIHLYLLFFVIIFILQPFSAILGNIVLVSFSIIDASTYFISLFSWWFGNVMGQLLITPMILILYSNLKNLNLNLIVLSTIIGTTVSYVILILYPINSLALLLSITISLSMLITIYWGLAYSSFIILMISIVLMLSVHYNIGFFTIETKLNNIINMNFYILAHIIFIYIQGLLSIERDNALNKMTLLNLNLKEQVEIETEKNREKELFLIQQSRHAQMGEMISMIAHQWRQPLNSLSLIIQGNVFKNKIGKFNDEDMEKLSHNSQKQISQMSKTIDDFRDFFKPNKNPLEFNVSKSILHALALLKPILNQESITIKTQLEDDVLLKGFSNELEQVLINILNNAKDALAERNIDKDRTIYISLKKENTDTIITIEDNAGGIKDDIIEKIFDPYFSTKNDKNGTGLGLYMSKSIIEGHCNGILSIQNTTNGAIFKIVMRGK